MLFFQKYIEFVENDTRRFRETVPVTIETLTYKHEAIAPRSLVEGKTILDLGSCFGATGHWCLSNGATSYTGVEFQEQTVNISSTLLKKYWNPDQFTIIKDEIENFLTNTTNKYDVVFACGMIYGFLNTYRILELITKVTNYCVVIDSSYPTELSHYKTPIIDIVTNQYMIKNHGKEDDQSYRGLGARPSPCALHHLMSNFGFKNTENIIFPKQLTDKTVHDAYHDLVDRKHGIKTPSRFIMRFYNDANTKVRSVLENLIDDVDGVELPVTYPLIKAQSSWEFDKTVATRFQQEAETHIPDYQKVIDLEISIIEKKFQSTDIKIIDVGSALGHTLDNLYSKGFTNIQGVESSQAMIDQSKHREKIIYSDTFPNDKFDVVLANWTVHFIKEKEKYLQAVFNSLNDNGILIVSDKMTQNPLITEMYYEWKLSNGVSLTAIKEKEQKLIGIMLSEHLDLYLEMLYRIGFSKVDLINSRFNFNTLLCCK
jgi:SAM-dependent methyltransferase